jgi:ribosomal protein S6
VVRVYECLILLDPDADTEGALAQIRAIRARHGVELLVDQPFKQDRLAYPGRCHRDGYYHWLCLRSRPEAIPPFEADLRLSEAASRWLITEIAPKMVEVMIEMAHASL